jgi:protein-arginine kinase activator protein McsA
LNEGCAHCGGAATLIVREDGATSSICSSCLDRIMPGMRLGSLRKQFIRDREERGVCPYCGWTNQQVAETALMGCPLCYEALEMPVV